MGKLVVLKFVDGDFEKGFAVSLQIGEERDRPTTEISGKLPPCPEMPLYYNHWQSSYRRLGQTYRLDADQVQITNVSTTQNCYHTAHILRARFNNWLQAEEFRPVREKWLERLLPTDEVRVILQADDSQLQRLPWHLWDLLERYPKAEIGLSSPTYDRIHKPPTPNHVVNILAIVGNSQGIDTKADQLLLQNCTNANVSFLVEPQLQQLTDHLWQQNWDILFFAGHSSSQDNDASGRIYLNQTDSLSINELKYALKKAIERGLQLAIFNSCDGLGLARELADLQIPQIIVMREPVPDQVAHEFLKYFLDAFANGESLYQAVRQGRERLQGLEDKFPCATWLPVICQNPAQIPPTWEDFIRVRNTHLFANVKQKFPLTVFSGLAIAAVVCGVRFLGLLQSTELTALDLMMRSRPLESPDQRMLIITIDDTDLAFQRQQGEILKGTSISDTSLQKLLTKLKQYQPSVIGLDIYRDFPAEQPNLVPHLQQTQNLVGVCKGSDTLENIKGIAPPPEIPQERIGYSDFIHDSDGVVRRHLMYMNQEPASLCSAPYALSMQLVFRYLLPKRIQPKFTPQGNLQLGHTVLPRLSSHASGYQGIDASGGQILLNYRANKKIAEQVTLTQFLNNPLNSRAINNKIILIGVTAKGDSPDYWSTPYGNLFNEQMPGVLLQAHMVSQILSHVLDGRPLLRVSSPWIDLLWISGWSLVGGIIAWRLSSLSRLSLAVGISCSVVYVSCFGVLICGVWLPFVPSIIALMGTTTVSAIQNGKIRVGFLTN
ncbi:CHASE2 domain-containing protein [Fortiea contorta]|uniref:CHASE2 domain-containing protein n=1 Tax=Fortiea contorta TaxID=1892405 RepID=UPI00034CE003|nr:CHASE2 domain-containing protein [Fortiea contorta]